MSKPIAGKRAFYARGQSDAACGISLRFNHYLIAKWPDWAKGAYTSGHFNVFVRARS